MQDFTQNWYRQKKEWLKSIAQRGSTRVSKRYWIERVKAKLQTGELDATDLGENLYPINIGGMNHPEYVLCVHDPRYCVYRHVPPTVWQNDNYANAIRAGIEELQALSEGQKITVHSANEVFSDFYDNIYSALGEGGLRDWL